MKQKNVLVISYSIGEPKVVGFCVLDAGMNQLYLIIKGHRTIDVDA